LSIAALSTIAKVWKQLDCPLIDKWVKKTWFIHIVEYCSALKKEKILYETR